MSALLSLLLDMGFEQSLAENALKATGDSSIDAAMDWIAAYQDKQAASSATLTLPPLPAAESMETESTPAAEPAAVAKSIKCDECGKLFTTPEQVSFHADKTKHSQFSESTDEKKPLTEEEKKEQLRKVEELMKQKRKEREEKEKADQLEMEKRRIQAGKELSSIKKKLEDEELKKIYDERRREKEEEKKARQRVKDMIEQDKLARKQKAAGGVETAAPPVEAPKALPQPTGIPNQPKDYKETRIQIRLANGSTLTQTFGAKEQLAAVRLFIDLKRGELDLSAVPDPFRLQTNFPRKIFDEDDYEKTLDLLGLVPSAVLMVSKA